MAENWKLEGTYFETCNCDVACPCAFLSAPTEGECTVLVGWHIDNGSFGDVNLDGLNVALAVHSPGHMMDVKWQAALYLDKSASEEQTNVLTQIFTGQEGGHPSKIVTHVGEVLGVKSIPIEYEAEGKRRSLKIENVADAEIEAIQGHDGDDVTIDNHILCIAPGHTAVVGKSKKLTYQDHGFNLEVSEKTGFYSPFTYQRG